MYLIAIVSPFIGFTITNTTGRLFNNYINSLIATFCMFVSFLLSLIIFFEVAIVQTPCYIVLAPWFNIELLSVYWSFCFDTITSIMFIVVTFISSLVHLYSIEYMSDDPHQGRFLGFLSLFTFFMLLLITADNLLIMFFGWEGIGLASYLLISFWFTRIQASKSAIKAMIVNRVGDIGLLFGICSLFLTFKTVDYSIIFSLVSCALNDTLLCFSIECNCFMVFSTFLFIGAVGKSAQIGLHLWLPDAMEAPTPVSALLHAATLVTAGIFLIIRCSYIFEQSSIVLSVITIIGGITAFLAASIGVVQNDIKRVIAYSTCSQLGYMVLSCGISEYSIALFHLANHALFKALLFLSAGTIIHGFNDEQDLRKMGSLIRIFPLAYIMIIIGSLALCGIPFYTGFYSKDAILGIALTNCNIYSNAGYFLLLAAACFTAFYSTRLLLYSFIVLPNGYKFAYSNAHEATVYSLVPLVFLGFGSLFGGFLFKDMFVGFGSPLFGNSIYSLYNCGFIDFEFASVFSKNIPFIITLYGVFVSLYFSKNWLLYNINNLKIRSAYYYCFLFLNRKWYFDSIYNELLIHRLIKFSYDITFKLIDKGIIEWSTPSGIAYLTDKYKKDTSQLHSGYISHYLLLVVAVIFTVLFFIIFNNIFNNLDFSLIFIAYFVIFSFNGVSNS
jgi:NADH-ubiquinone oxidoreductase chain 5